MSETKATPQKQIKLLKPHRHAGRNYEAGATIRLAEHKADWLIGIKTAEASPEPEPAAAAKASAAPTNAPKPAKD